MATPSHGVSLPRSLLYLCGDLEQFRSRGPRSSETSARVEIMFGSGCSSSLCYSSGTSTLLRHKIRRSAAVEVSRDVVSNPAVLESTENVSPNVLQIWRRLAAEHSMNVFETRKVQK